MENQEHIKIERLKELSVIQLNKLVMFLKLKKYYSLADMRTLRYNQDVINEIAEYCSVFNMINALSLRLYPNENRPVKIEAYYGYYKIGITMNDGGFIKWYRKESLVDVLFDAIIDNLKEVIGG
jgi:hypothetical protein